MNTAAQTFDSTSHLTPIVLLDDGETWGGPGHIAFIDTDAVDADGGELPDNLPVLKLGFGWSEEDATVAKAEGWEVVATPDSSDPLERLLSIQCCDQAAIFSSDDAAIAHVYRKAMLGSALHHRALMRALFQPGQLPR